MSAPLFSPFELGPLKLENRIVISPMCQYSALDGSASAWHRTHIGNLSLSGAGLLLLEATAVEAAGRITPFCLGLYSDANEQALDNVLEAVREYSDMPIGIQLCHAGRKASSEPPWRGGKLIPAAQGGWATYAPSPLAHNDGEALPAALDRAGLARIREAFVASARRAARLDLAAVELHFAHGYLLHQFLSPLANQRDDAWGGTPEKRRRFVLEIARAIRAEIGPDKTMAIKLNSADFQRGGFSEDESIEVVHALAAEGIDLLEVSGGTYSSAAMLGVDPTLKESTRKREAYFLDYALRVREELPDLPLMLTGGFRSAEAMEDAVASGAIDVVGLGRPLTVEPDVPRLLLDGTTTESHVRPKRSGIRLIDSLTELTAYTVQMWRMADGREPAPRRHPAINVAQYMVRNGRDSIRVGRRGL